jgi:hypothetical protein
MLAVVELLDKSGDVGHLHGRVTIQRLGEIEVERLAIVTGRGKADIRNIATGLIRDHPHKKRGGGRIVHRSRPADGRLKRSRSLYLLRRKRLGRYFI